MLICAFNLIRILLEDIGQNDKQIVNFPPKMRFLKHDISYFGNATTHKRLLSPMKQIYKTKVRYNSSLNKRHKL